MISQNVHYYPLTTQSVSIGTTSAAITNAVDDHINIVRLLATASCFVELAKSPTATTSKTYLAANREEYFTIHPGEKVAVIEDVSGSGGTLYVTEMTR